MSVTDWFRRLFSPGTSTGSADDDAALREEYGDQAGDGSEPGFIAGGGGISGYSGLEDAQAVEGVEEETEAPRDPAP